MLVNKSNKVNVPFGKYKYPLICDADRLRACSKALQHVELEHGDFASILARAKEGDFVYIDPPYIPAGETADFMMYQPGGFDMNEQTRLQAVASQLIDNGVHVLLSASMTTETLYLYDSSFFELNEVLRSVPSTAIRTDVVRSPSSSSWANKYPSRSGIRLPRAHLHALGSTP